MNIYSAFKNNSLLKRIIIYGFSDGLSKIAPFLILPIILKFLNPSEFGYVTNFTALAQLFFPCIMLNGHTFLTVEFHKMEFIKRIHLEWNIIYTIIFATIIVGFFSPLYSHFLFTYYGLEFKWVILAIITAMLNAIIMSFQTSLRMNESIRQFSFLQISNSILSAILAVTLVVFTEVKWQGRVIALFITSLITGVFCISILFKKNKILPPLNFKIIKENLKFGLPLLPHSLSGWGKSAIEKGMITTLTSISLNGILAAASLPLMIVSMVSTAIFSAFNPEILKNISNIDKNIGNENDLLKYKIVKLSFLMVGIMIGIIILSYPISYLLFNYYLDKSYIEGLKMIPMLLLTSFFNTIYSIMAIYIMNEKKTSLLSIITVSTTLFQIVLGFLGLKYYGIMGFLIIGLISAMLQSTIVAYYAQKLRPMPWFYFLHLKK